MASMSVMDERPADATQHLAPLSSVNGPSRAPPMSPMRWQIEPPPLSPGAGAQWLIAALVALGPFSLTMYQPALPSIASASKRVWIAYGEPDGGLLCRNTCGEPSRGPRRGQQVDHAWERSAACRSRAPACVRLEARSHDLVGAGASDDLAHGHGNRDAQCHGGSCRTVSNDGRSCRVPPGVRNDGGRSAE